MGDERRRHTRIHADLPCRFVDESGAEDTGVVVWSHLGDDGQYDTGVFFPELGEEQRGLLHAFVNAPA
jgi:hypothetical protein